MNRIKKIKDKALNLTLKFDLFVTRRDTEGTDLRTNEVNKCPNIIAESDLVSFI